MKAAKSIADLKDPPVKDWEALFKDDIHCLVLVAAETEGLLGAITKKLLTLINEAGVTNLHIQHGKSLKNEKNDGLEHFGYVDGRSQPLMLIEDIDHENKTAGTDQWDPVFPLDTALVLDKAANDPFAHGSYFVFRKLEQAVRAFKTQEQHVADLLQLKGDARELAGAMVVGRFEDGTPVTMSNEAKGEAPANDFNYDADPGARCPFHAHIRKVNPRGQGGAQPQPDERLHIMARRGIPFEDKKRVTHPAELPDSGSLKEFNKIVAPHLPVDGVGLLFMAYNVEIGRQFKFTQQIWANNTAFPVKPPGNHGIDPVIGQGVNTAGDQRMEHHWDAPSLPTIATPFAGFVTMKGGEYFFSPSLTFLKGL